MNVRDSASRTPPSRRSLIVFIAVAVAGMLAAGLSSVGSTRASRGPSNLDDSRAISTLARHQPMVTTPARGPY
ncbi:MAG: hypothetical protein QOE07_2921 [Acidimicrobiaceae bacterium]|jgi:hypothetical protein|nr:hypothetical protein [Acidimicrobiaceae bacterium]